MKKRYAAIALTALIIIGALFALLRRNDESDPIAPDAPADASSPSNESEQPDIKEQETADSAAEKTYHFLTWQDALNEYARQAGEECERLKAEGRPQPEFYAVINFNEKLRNDPELAALNKAMEKFMPFPPIKGMSEAEREKYDRWNDTAIPWEIWSSASWIMVWAGKLPGGSQYIMVSLPNGEVFPLEKNHQLRAAYRTRTPPRVRTAEGARVSETLRRRESALYTALINASDAEFDSVVEELKKVKKSITALQSPTISSPRVFKAGAEDTYKIIELDLGVVDVAHHEH